MKKLLWLCLIALGCTPSENATSIDIQGHRGARGLVPENSLEAFLLAAKMGVNTLELDLVVSKDGQIVVSHEPYFSPSFCLDTLGSEIPKDSIINIYELDYKQITQFDCGSKVNSRFPDQDKFPTVKPLLLEVFEEVEEYVILNRDPVFYNIELKTSRETDEIYHPSPEQFSDMVYELISGFGMSLWEKVNIQSFDFRTLQYFHETYPDVKLALLIENELPWEENIDSLGFTPEIYSCYFNLLDQEKVDAIQQSGMKVIPWTVNEVPDLKQMLDLQVDGIITDYPDRALALIENE